MKQIIQWLSLLLPLYSFAAQETINQDIIHYINAQSQQQIALLEQLVNINSGTTNISGIRQVGTIVEAQLQQLGFHTQWFDEPSTMHRAGTLIAEHKGRRGKRLLLIGHLDTVFPKQSPFQHFERHGAQATGPGVVDDKGGIVVILYAL